MLADCKLCGCSGWLFWTGPDGLCRNCGNLAGSELRQRAEIIDSAEKEAAETLNPHSKIAKLDIAVSELRVLADYEEKGFKTPIEAARMRLGRTAANRDALILKTAREEASAIMESLGSVPRPGEKLKKLEAFQINLLEYRRRCGDGRTVELLHRRIKTTAFRIRLSARLEDARAAHKDQKPADAKRLYQEALTLLERDGKDDPSYDSQHAAILKRLESG